MAWLVGEGFDTVSGGVPSNADIWASVSAIAVTAQTGKYGRGLACMMGNNSASAGVATTINFGNISVIFVNIVLMTSVLVGNSVVYKVGFRLQDGASNQCGIWMSSDGVFFVTNGLVGGTVLATSPLLVPYGTGTWHHCQFKITIHNSTGRVQLRLDGDTSDTWDTGNINTRNGTTNFYTNTITLNSSAANQVFVDDFFAHSDQGAAPNDWIPGETCAVTQVPTSDITSQWTRNGGASNFSRVAQVITDSDTTYNSSNVVAQEDKFGLAALSYTPASILAVQTRFFFRQEDAGPHLLKARIDSGGFFQDGADRIPITSYTQYLLNSMTDPATGSAWTQSGVEAMKIGYINDL